MSLLNRSLFFGLAGTILFFTACKNSNTQQVTQQHGKDTSHVAVDTIAPKIAAYTNRITSNPNDADAYWNRGKLEMLQKSLTASLGDLQHAVKIDSSKNAYYNSLGDIYFILGHTREAKNSFEKAVSLNPVDTEAILKLGEIYMDVQKYDAAIGFADKALILDKHNANAYFLKGLCFLQKSTKGDSMRAISSIQTAIEQNPDFFNAYIQLGLIYSAKHSIHALDYFGSAARIEPNSIEPYYDKGMFYQQAGDLVNATKAYDQALQIDPNYKSALYNMGYIHFIQNDFPRALQYFDKTIQNDSTNALAYLGRGECYENMNEPERAAGDYQLALKHDPDLTAAKEALNGVKGKAHK